MAAVCCGLCLNKSFTLYLKVTFTHSQTFETSITKFNSLEDQTLANDHNTGMDG